MAVYNKLFTKILDSSIWLEPTPTRIVWITLLAAMDEDGYAHFSAIENLALRARVTVEEAAAAVECFLAPDPNSGNPDNEGRRIERVPGGYMVLNAKAHRAAVNRIILREQTRIRVARHRSKSKVTTNAVTCSLPTVTPASACVLASAQGKGSAEGKGAALAEMELFQAKLCKLYSQSSKRRWSHAEQSTLFDLTRSADFAEELEEIVQYRGKLKAEEIRFFPQSLERLLSQWTPTLDKARTYSARNTKEKSLPDKELDRLCSRQ